jgi:hypothetical protein
MVNAAFVIVLLLASSLGGMWLVFSGVRLLVFGKSSRFPWLGDFSPQQVLAVKVPWGASQVLAGAWLFAVPCIAFAVQLPFNRWTLLSLAGLAILPIGQSVAVRRIKRGGA